MSEESRGFSEAARRLAAAGRIEAKKAVDAAFAAGRPVHDAGTGEDAGVMYRVWPDGRRERVETSKEQTPHSRTARIA
ncbi:MAG TPA: hypothetical protein VHS78_13415 [Candidatus Elarobacter sp.]|jgi:hypothetical protein|nr:hypothetical protein [Candidatus Elarobacter sp.]